jgi:hypothetical protein|tara:strand:+ start:2556 stop:3995 length:1440 start_codon:yes stop_codon:yes gene_type:complete
MSGNFKAGEFSIESLSIVNQESESIDVTDLTLTIELFESIYNKFCTGNIILLDGLNILSNYRLSGQEFIRVSLKQKEGLNQEPEKKFTIDKTFRIYKVSDIKRAKEGTQVYKLNFCDPRMFFVRRRRLSKVMRGSYDRMLQNALIEEANIKPAEFDAFEETEPKNLQFICPNWTVAKFVDYVVTESNIGDDAEWKNGMFFYQTLNGGFRFSSIDTMMGREFPINFSFKPRSGDLGTETIDLNAEGGLNSMIKTYYKPQQFDTLRGTVGGAYGSLQKVYDPVKKQEQEFVYDLDQTMKRGKHLSGFPMIRTGEFEKTLTTENMIDDTQSPAVTEVDIDLSPNKEFDSIVESDYTTTHLFDNETTVDSPETFSGLKYEDNAKLERRALLETLQQHRIIVTIPMRTDLTVGTVIKLDIPQPESGSGREDELNDNRYLITDLSVILNVPDKEGELNLECVKESYAKDIAKAKPLEDAEGPKIV